MIRNIGLHKILKDYNQDLSHFLFSRLKISIVILQ